jgi:hypothetical protein
MLWSQALVLALGRRREGLIYYNSKSKEGKEV